ncbi:PREDICTED: uncharacterized protein LOC101306101 [Fragaria vesca subsp. vesca]
MKSPATPSVKNPQFSRQIYSEAKTFTSRNFSARSPATPNPANRKIRVGLDGKTVEASRSRRSSKPRERENRRIQATKSWTLPRWPCSQLNRVLRLAAPDMGWSSFMDAYRPFSDKCSKEVQARQSVTILLL